MRKKKAKGAAPSGGRRPRRQRTQVQHYTDDNPSTFTKKKKRRWGSNESGSSGSDSEDDSIEQQQTSSQNRNNFQFDEVLDTPDKADKKKKRKRPGKSSMHDNERDNHKHDGHLASKLQEMPPPSPPKTVMMPHTASLAPILPLESTCPLARHSLAQQYPVVFGRGLGVPTPPKKPEWEHVPAYDFYFPEDYKIVSVPIADEDENSSFAKSTNAPLLKKGPWPVCRVVTCVCQYQDYIAVGDSAGFILLYTTGARGMRVLTRLDTGASRREHPRQREIQGKVETQCRHKPELLEKRSPFWATAKTPNAIECITWVGSLIIILTAKEMEALKLNFSNISFSSTSANTCSLGGSQNCEVLWTLPVTSVGGPRKNSSSSLLTGGELEGSHVQLHSQEAMLLWNTWGVGPVTMNQKESRDYQEDKASQSREGATKEVTHDWPLLLLRDALRPGAQPDFVKVIPFQRQDEEEKLPAVPVKRSPGRPPKKKPKPKIPVTETELLWSPASKCHAALWDRISSDRESRFILAYSTTGTVTSSDAQVQLALFVLTDDSREADTVLPQADKPQYARLKRQVTVPLSGSIRNVANVPEVTVCQSPNGSYTLVAGSRGVRMYETDTMTLLRVYGENVSLHGKSMVWKSCFVIDNRLQQQLYQQQEEQFEPQRRNDNDELLEEDVGKTVLRQNRQGFVWIEQDNPLTEMADSLKESVTSNKAGNITRRRNASQKGRTSSSLELDSGVSEDDPYFLHQSWIVGIPHHFRGPKELQETLYFWQGPEKLPLFTLSLPRECGGAQSVQPLVSAPSRSNGMWMRLMLASVHGECFELAPCIKSDFPGNMYNPGYFVIQDNIEYIEDEDELDKVMIDVPEKPEEPEDGTEVGSVSPVGSNIEREVEDPELAEAIRLSLLESQRKTQAPNEASKSDDDNDDDHGDDETNVIVKDYYDVEGDAPVISFDPEPFLRKDVLPDVESETMLGADSIDKEVKDAEFARDVLAMLPQVRSAQRRWQKQKNRMASEEGLSSKAQKDPTIPQRTNGVSEHQSVVIPARGGKGKRARAGNVEGLLKASVDPVLRHHMASADRIWGDGSGSTLQEDAWDDCVAPLTGPSQLSGDYTNSTEGGKQTRKQLSVQLPASKDDEEKKEIAMELLHLSPRTTPESSSAARALISTNAVNLESDFSLVDGTAARSSAAPVSTETQPDSGLQVAIIELEAYSGLAQQYSCTGTVDIPLTLEDCNNGSDLQEYGISDGKRDSVAGSDALQFKTSGQTITTYEPIQGTGAVPGKLAAAAFHICRCPACQGRMVMHSCGKRDLPIDFEAIAQAEKEKREREEEEKKRQKIEKRKQAEARRREAKKRKKEQEKREKQEKEDRERREKEERQAELRRIREAEVAEAKARMANIGDCLGSDSPELKLKGGSASGDTVHFSIASAWEEHAQKFSHSAAVTSNQKEQLASRKLQATACNSDALDALASMAEAATQRPPMKHPARVENNAGRVVGGDRVIENVTQADHAIPETTHRDCDIADSFANTAGATADRTSSEKLAKAGEAFQHTASHGKNQSTQAQTAAYNTAQAVAEQKQVVHGFFSLEDAYPRQAHTAAASSAAALAARRNRVLNSYHAIENGSPAQPNGNGRVGVTPRTHGFGSAHDSVGHSFPIGPSSETKTGFHQQNQPKVNNLLASVGSPETSSLPYFGYTNISNNFKAKVSLGVHASSALITSSQGESKPNVSATQTTASVVLPAGTLRSVVFSGHSNATPTSSTNWHHTAAQAMGSQAQSNGWPLQQGVGPLVASIDPTTNANATVRYLTPLPTSTANGSVGGIARPSISEQKQTQQQKAKNA